MARPLQIGQWTVVDLKFEVKPLRFLRAEVPVDRHIPFALVWYSVTGQPDPKYGLRLDLDKRVFLDHLDDREQEEAAKRAIPQVIAVLQLRA